MLPSPGIYQIRKPFAALLVLLGFFLLFLDAALLAQNRKFRAIMTSQVPRLAVAIGTMVPPIQGIETGGGESSVEYGVDRRGTVLFVFSTECSVCTKNWPAWEALARHIKPESYGVVYANLSKGVGTDYLTAHNLLGAKVFSQLDPKTTVAYNLGLTPQVLLINPQGKVEHVWLGLLKGDQLAELEQTLGLSADLIADTKR